MKTDLNLPRRRLVFGAAAAGITTAANAEVRTDTAPRVLNGKPMPEPSNEQTAGPVRPERGSQLADKVAVVTGAARRIGRAIAVEFAANGQTLSLQTATGTVRRCDGGSANAGQRDQRKGQRALSTSIAPRPP